MKEFSSSEKKASAASKRAQENTEENIGNFKQYYGHYAKSTIQIWPEY